MPQSLTEFIYDCSPQDQWNWVRNRAAELKTIYPEYTEQLSELEFLFNEFHDFGIHQPFMHRTEHGIKFYWYIGKWIISILFPITKKLPILEAVYPNKQYKKIKYKINNNSIISRQIYYQLEAIKRLT